MPGSAGVSLQLEWLAVISSVKIGVVVQSLLISLKVSSHSTFH